MSKTPSKGSKTPTKTPSKTPTKGGKYKIIAGKRYERTLVEIADDCQIEISRDEATRIWGACTGNSSGQVTEVEQRTIQWILDSFEMAADAYAFLEPKLRVTKRKRYDETVDGVLVDGGLLDDARLRCVGGGKLGKEDALALCAMATGGENGAVTAGERAAIAHALAELKSTAVAKNVLGEFLAAHPAPPPTAAAAAPAPEESEGMASDERPSKRQATTTTVVSDEAGGKSASVTFAVPMQDLDAPAAAESDGPCKCIIC